MLKLCNVRLEGCEDQAPGSAREVDRLFARYNAQLPVKSASAFEPLLFIEMQTPKYNVSAVIHNFLCSPVHLHLHASAPTC